MPSSDRYPARRLIGKVLIAPRENKHRYGRAYIVYWASWSWMHHSRGFSRRLSWRRIIFTIADDTCYVLREWFPRKNYCSFQRQSSTVYCAPANDGKLSAKGNPFWKGSAQLSLRCRLCLRAWKALVKSAYSQLDEFKFPYLIVRADICRFCKPILMPLHNPLVKL